MTVGRVFDRADGRSHLRLTSRVGLRSMLDLGIPFGKRFSGWLDGSVSGFCFILNFTPLLWLSGLLAFLIPIWTLYSFVKAHCWRCLRDPAVCGWFAIAGFQCISTIINWGNTAEGIGTLIYRFVSAPVSGWLLMGMLIGLGKYAAFSESEKLALGVARLGFYLLCLGPPLLLIAMLFGVDNLQWLTPVGHLIPSSLPSAQFQFTAQFLTVDEFVGQTMPRLVLFYPWPTCLGFAGAAILFISLTIRDHGSVKTVGICGGIFGVLASTSRAAIVGTIGAGMIFGILQLPLRRRPVAMLVIATCILVCACAPLLFRVDPASLVLDAKSEVSALRQDSSSARQAVYDETLARFKRSPTIGYGWQGDILEDTIPLPIGSHSTIYGLLYTGGVMTLIPFVFAAIALGLDLFRKVAAGGSREHSAFCIYVVLMVMCYGECIFSFAVPAFFAFLYLGCGLSPRRADLDGSSIGAEVSMAKRSSLSFSVDT